MSVNHLRALQDQFLFGERLVNFERFDRGSDLLRNESKLGKVLQKSGDNKWIVLINIRWLGVVFKHGFYYIFNNHPGRSDSMPDYNNRAAAAVLRVKTAKEA